MTHDDCEAHEEYWRWRHERPDTRPLPPDAWCTVDFLLPNGAWGAATVRADEVHMVAAMAGSAGFKTAIRQATEEEITEAEGREP